MVTRKAGEYHRVNPELKFKAEPGGSPRSARFRPRRRANTLSREADALMRNN
jgi:hypothetical protein